MWDKFADYLIVNDCLINNGKYGFIIQWILYEKVWLKEVRFFPTSLNWAVIFTRNFLVVNWKIICCGEIVQLFVWWGNVKTTRVFAAKTYKFRRKKWEIGCCVNHKKTGGSIWSRLWFFQKCFFFTFDFQHTSRKLFNKSYIDIRLVLLEIWRGGRGQTVPLPPKKLFSKSPALLRLKLILIVIFNGFLLKYLLNLKAILYWEKLMKKEFVVRIP